MSKATKKPEPKVELNEGVKTGEFEARVFSKSDWPKTPGETIRMVINIFLSFFPL